MTEAFRSSTANRDNRMTYAVHIDGLDATIAAAPVLPKHVGLIEALRRVPSLANARLLTHRGDAWLTRRKVLSADGALIHDDHAAWLKLECASDGGNVAETLRRLRGLDHRLTECALDTLYVVHDRGGANCRQDDFVQLTVDVEDETIERRLFATQASSWRDAPRDLRDLIQEAEDGERFDAPARARYRPTAYRLRRCIDAGAFLREAAVLETAKRNLNRRTRLVLTSNDGSERVSTVGDLAPDVHEYAWPGQRLIDEWTLSSAGRQGHRFCAHWALQTSDYTSPAGERDMSLVPLWTHARKMAAIKSVPKSPYELFGKLEAIDRRVGVPFAWYFYMLHGNLVGSWAGERVLEAAEAGKLVLPEHDYQILKRWNQWSYGF